MIERLRAAARRVHNNKPQAHRQSMGHDRTVQIAITYASIKGCSLILRVFLGLNP